MQKLKVIVFSCFLLSSCATNNAHEEVDLVPSSQVRPVYDPYEKFNRRVYKMNYYIDKYVMLPVTKRYEDVTPTPAKQGISNFLSNLGEITTFINATLQLKPDVAGNSAARFALNTTLGVFGLFEVAEDAGLHKHKEDFGQTLAYYGVSEGPYLILPVLGPSNLRDTAGLAVNRYTFNAVDPLNYEDNKTREIGYVALQGLDTRAKVPVGYFGSGSPFEYELLRRYYTDSRNIASGSFKDRFNKK